MSVGSWQPDSEPTVFPEQALTAALQIQLDPFAEQAPESIQALLPFMKSTPDQWSKPLESLSDDELKQLARFFTLAEAHWAEWFAGDKNPVIWICKVLKKRGAFPDKELTQWIKQNTDNRFLPYGNALG